MTTLKFGGFWFGTDSISWNLVLRCLFLIAFFYLLISNPRWADYNGWLYGAWANRGSETGRLNSHKRTITPKLTKYLDIFNSESSSVHKKKPTNSFVDIIKRLFYKLPMKQKEIQAKEGKEQKQGMIPTAKLIYNYCWGQRQGWGEFSISVYNIQVWPG